MISQVKTLSEQQLLAPSFEANGFAPQWARSPKAKDK